MLTLYGMTDSGNCYKPRLLLAKLGVPFRHVEVSTTDGGTRAPDYLDKNPNGKVPLLELEDGRLLAESNAILLHLAEGTRFLPADAYQRALCYQWLFFEQYSHEPQIAVRRSLVKYPHLAANATEQRMAALLEGGNKALAVMEEGLAKSPFFAGETISVADLALYAYTHDAAIAGFDLARFPFVSAWLSRVAEDAGHVEIGWKPA
ncbi:glutathione S-transferase family protein [Aliihoeflea sp. PC F10.4]